MSSKRNALFSFAPGFLSPKQRRAKGRQPYNRRVAASLRKARKHKYDWIPGGGVARGKGMSAVRSDVALALRGQGFSGGQAKKLARSASGSDFDSIFRSALSKAKGNPMAAKKKSKKKKRNKRRMPAGLAAYWAKKRAKKNSRRKKKNSRRRNRRPRVRTIVKTKIVYRNKRRKKQNRRKKANPRSKVNTVRIPGGVTKAQARAITRAIARATGRPTRNRHGKH